MRLCSVDAAIRTANMGRPRGEHVRGEMVDQTWASKKPWPYDVVVKSTAYKDAGFAS